LDACLTFFNCPEEEWRSLRTTNIIERLNKEVKRRPKPMEIIAGEQACYTLLAFISLKMELHWRSSPVGKVPKNLPLLKELEGRARSQGPNLCQAQSAEGRFSPAPWPFFTGHFCRSPL
jgi:transposase-like protein